MPITLRCAPVECPRKTGARSDSYKSSFGTAHGEMPNSDGPQVCLHVCFVYSQDNVDSYKPSRQPLGLYNICGCEVVLRIFRRKKYCSVEVCSEVGM